MGSGADPNKFDAKAEVNGDGAVISTVDFLIDVVFAGADVVVVVVVVDTGVVGVIVSVVAADAAGFLALLGGRRPFATARSFVRDASGFVSSSVGLGSSLVPPG